MEPVLPARLGFPQQVQPELLVSVPLAQLELQPLVPLGLQVLPEPQQAQTQPPERP